MSKNPSNVVVTYHVRYKPSGLNEWWDWKKLATPEEAVTSFRSYEARVQNTYDQHIIKTTSIVTEEVIPMPE